MQDWIIRTVKTFIQVFFGTLIPALVAAMSHAPAVWSDVLPWLGSIFTPQLIIGDCLAAAICAAWNIILEHNKRMEGTDNADAPHL